MSAPPPREMSVNLQHARESFHVSTGDTDFAPGAKLWVPFALTATLWFITDRPGVATVENKRRTMASESGVILSISHTVRRVYLSITLARWRAKMLPRCSD